VELLIVREDGHAVRHLNLGLRDLGINEISWDGRDEKGEMVGSGVYLIEVVANEFHATAKVAVVRQ
jgi:flagellar hook assembly protein FlgD